MFGVGFVAVTTGVRSLHSSLASTVAIPIEVVDVPQARVEDVRCVHGALRLHSAAPTLMSTRARAVVATAALLPQPQLALCRRRRQRECSWQCWPVHACDCRDLWRQFDSARLRVGVMV
jgi:hypothetical protein